jgi:hypothetical protein
LTNPAAGKKKKEKSKKKKSKQATILYTDAQLSGLLKDVIENGTYVKTYDLKLLFRYRASITSNFIKCGFEEVSSRNDHIIQLHFIIRVLHSMLHS